MEFLLLFCSSQTYRGQKKNAPVRNGTKASVSVSDSRQLSVVPPKLRRPFRKQRRFDRSVTRTTRGGFRRRTPGERFRHAFSGACTNRPVSAKKLFAGTFRSSPVQYAIFKFSICKKTRVVKMRERFFQKQTWTDKHRTGCS